MHAAIGSLIMHTRYIRIFGFAQYARLGYVVLHCGLSRAVEESCSTPLTYAQTPEVTKCQPYVFHVWDGLICLIMVSLVYNFLRLLYRASH
jgi:hypothetical protein